MKAAPGSNLLNVTGAKVAVSRLVGVVGGGGTGIYNGGVAVRLGEDVNLAACSIPLGGSGAFSIGTFQLNGATPVAVAQPMVVAQDRVVLTRQAIAGTPGPPPTCVINPGVGFTVTGTAGDLSTYAYKLV